AEGGDIRLHPPQGGDLVEHSEVEVVVSTGAEVAEDAESVGHGDDDDVLLGGQGVRVVDLRISGPGDVGSTVNPHEDGQPRLGGGVLRHGHAHAQTVFADGEPAELIEGHSGVRVAAQLRARRAGLTAVDEVHR